MKKESVVAESLFMCKKEEQRGVEIPVFFSCSGCRGPVSFNDIFCSCCESLQKPNANISHYGALDLPSSFYLTEDQIEKAYKKRITQVHPDRFTDALESEKKHATLWSAAINKAYEALKDPLERLKYWVFLEKSIPVDESPPVELLSAIMEVEEALNNTNDKDAWKKKIEKSYKGAFSASVKSLEKSEYEKAAAFLKEATYWLKVGRRYNISIGNK